MRPTMFDFSDAFADSFASLTDAMQRGMDGGFKFERRDGIVQAKKCDSEKELAAWFRAFARSCKAA